MNLADIKVGSRVEIHPACDAWMQGDRFGTVVKIGRKYAHLKMERSGRTLQLTGRLIDHEVITVEIELPLSPGPRVSNSADHG